MIPAKLYLYGGLALVLFLLIGGTVLGFRYLINRVAETEKINAELTVANKQLDKRIESLILQQEQINRENSAARQRDTNAQTKVQNTNKYYADKTNKIEVIRAKKPQLLFNIINNNMECQRIHFLEDGTCLNGIWKPAY